MANLMYHLNILYKLQKYIKNNYFPIIAVFFVSSTSGSFLLKNLLKNNEISENDIIPLYFLGMFIFGIHIILFYAIPMAVSLGWYVGGIYILIKFLVTLNYLIISVLMLKRRGCNIRNIEFKSKSGGLYKAIKETFKQYFRVLASFVPSVLIITYLIEHGLLDVVENFAGSLLNTLNLSPTILVIVLTGLATISGAIGIASGLLDENILSPNEIILSLIIAEFLNRIVLYLRKYLPIQLSIFGKFGIKLATLHLIVYEISLLVVIVIWYFFFIL
ncbi:hypothetical protein [Methanocaldococcus sp. FS406-22]|uniref:hypothetical protein n=1 Tax=Methanocaldococcus sp. (strain FS406-22) TaxID=644281 RepID=UPI000AF5354B|nr:hypothetical protein [Methanocaldococcus sp. FS406-22]